MKNVLEELWYGNIAPMENLTRDVPEVKKLLALFARNRDGLLATLNDAEKDLLEKYEDCQNELVSICEKLIFIGGFKLGANITFAALGEDEA